MIKISIDENTELSERTTLNLKNLIEGLLFESVVKVQFVKSDSTMRLMRASLAPKYLPEDAPARETKPNPGLVAAIDIDVHKEKGLAASWRSFKISCLRKLLA